MKARLVAIIAAISNVAPSAVSVTLSSGSVAVDATITGYDLTAIADKIVSGSATLASAVAERVGSIGGLPTTGTISVSTIQATVTTAPTPFTTVSPEEGPSANALRDGKIPNAGNANFSSGDMGATR